MMFDLITNEPTTYIEISLSDYTELIRLKTERDLMLKALILDVPRDMVIDTYASQEEKGYYKWL